MNSPSADVELVARVVDGDSEALNDIMRQHEGRVFAVCVRMMGDREKALDSTQETFLTVFRKAGQFKGDAALGTWIYRIAVNTCYDQLRKEKRRRAAPLPENIELRDASAEEQIESAGLRPMLERALGALPDEFRSAVVLSDLEGLSINQVALILRIPLGTAKSRVFRGRRLLAKSLGNQTT